jgi:DNA replication protein DnaC
MTPEQLAAVRARTQENMRAMAENEKANAERKAQEKLECDAENKRQLDEWLAKKSERDAVEKKAKDIAAKAADALRKAQHAAIIASVSNDYPGLSTERRTTLNTAILGNPTGNYILSGSGGIGKSTMLAALAQIATVNGKRALVTSGMDWEATVRSNSYADFSDKQQLAISAEGLRNSRPCFIGFDEIDKITKSEFLLNHLHALIDAAISGHHQLVITTNLSQEEFKAMFGDSLVWRLLLPPATGNRGGLGCKWAAFSE